MTEDRAFEPWLGGVRSRHSHADRKYVHAVIAAASRHGRAVHAFQKGRAPFKGLLIGRGSAAAAALRMTDRHAAFRARDARVLVRIMRLRGNGFRAARMHLRYIERDGVTRTGERGFVYSATQDRANGRDFLDRCRDDRHQFRITASARNGDQYEDLKPMIRRFMLRVEDDLGTSLDWVAADHADTRYPHTHILLRGRDDRGNDLVIAPGYIFHGMRERLTGIVSIDLGPELEARALRTLDLEVEAERVTSLERRLLRAIDDTGAITVPSRNMVEHSILTGRLHKLGALGLAAPVAGGRWRVPDDLEATLQTVSERARMSRALERHLASAGIVRAPAERVVHDSQQALDVSGRFVSDGLVSAAGERSYLIVDGVDGRSHYVETAQLSSNRPFGDGAILRLVRGEGTGRSSEPPLAVELLSSMPLPELPHYEGPTWLDRELVSPRVAPRDLGFGQEVRRAFGERGAWLIEQGFALRSRTGLTCRVDLLSLLEERELVRTSEVLARETGHGFARPEEGRPFAGTVRRIDLPTRCYAMIDNGDEFTLVPWQPAFENALGKAIRATAAADGLSWTLSRGREIEI